MAPPFTRDNLPPEIPPEAVAVLDAVGFLKPDTLAVGDPAPDVPLYTLEGERQALREMCGERPLVLVFGSYT